MSTIQIVSRFDGTKVLFECEVTKDQQDSGVAMRHALEKAAGARANLYGANLYGADLRGADLYGANLRGANLYAANLGDRRIVQIGPIGSRGDYLIYQWGRDHTGAPLDVVSTGCFHKTLEEFRQAVEQTHGRDAHGIAYRAAIALIEALRGDAELPPNNETAETAEVPA